MPVSCVLDAEQGVLMTRMEGELGIDELLAHVEKRCCPEWLELPECADVVDGLHVRQTEVRTLVERMRQLTAGRRIGPIAIAAVKDESYGVGRMFSMLCESYGATVEVFRDKETALAWLSQTVAQRTLSRAG